MTDIQTTSLLQLFYQCFYYYYYHHHRYHYPYHHFIINILCYASSVVTCIVGGAIQMNVDIYIYIYLYKHVSTLTCGSVRRHLDVYSRRTDRLVRFFVQRSTSDGTEHCSSATGLPLSVPSTHGPRLQLKRLALHHPVLTETVESVLKAVHSLKVRLAHGPAYSFNCTTVYFITHERKVIQ